MNLSIESLCSTPECEDALYAEAFCEKAREVGLFAGVVVGKLDDDQERYAAVVMPQAAYDTILENANAKAAARFEATKNADPQEFRLLESVPLTLKKQPSDGVSTWYENRREALLAAASSYDYFHPPLYAVPDEPDREASDYFAGNDQFEELEAAIGDQWWEVQRMFDPERYGVTFTFQISSQVGEAAAGIIEPLEEHFFPGSDTDNITHTGWCLLKARTTQELIEVDMEWPIRGDIATVLRGAMHIIAHTLRSQAAEQEAA